jgi:hypothetical protein
MQKAQTDCTHTFERKKMIGSTRPCLSIKLFVCRAARVRHSESKGVLKTRKDYGQGRSLIVTHCSCLCLCRVVSCMAVAWRGVAYLARTDCFR